MSLVDDIPREVVSKEGSKVVNIVEVLNCPVVLVTSGVVVCASVVVCRSVVLVAASVDVISGVDAGTVVSVGVLDVLTKLTFDDPHIQANILEQLLHSEIQVSLLIKYKPMQPMQ